VQSFLFIDAKSTKINAVIPGDGFREKYIDRY